MPSLSLLQCPEEVQLGIIELLPPSHLVNLCRASKALRNLTQPLIYSEIQLVWNREYYPPIGQLLHLLRTLLERPDLCHHVKSLDFVGDDCIDYDDPPDSDEMPDQPEPPSLPVDQLVTAIKRIGVSKSAVDDWTTKVLYSDAHQYLKVRTEEHLYNMKKTHWDWSDAAVAALVSLLPQLERLYVGVNWTTKKYFLGTLFRSVLGSTSQHSSQCVLTPFPSLKDIAVPPFLEGQPNLDPENTAEALSLFYLPSVQRLSVSIDNPTQFSWPYSLPPDPSSLTSLEIFRLRECRLAPILSVTKNLKKLRYNWVYRPDLDDKVSKAVVMLDTMAEAFLQVSGTLEELEVIAATYAASSRGHYEPPDIYFQGSLVRLAGMRTLRSLQIPWSFLTGSNNISESGGIGPALPNVLEHLNFPYFETWYEVRDRDDAMLSAFEMELEKGALSHVTSLKRVCFPRSHYRLGLSETCKQRLQSLRSRFDLVFSHQTSS